MNNPCKSCGAYSGHSIDCPDIDLEDAKSKMRFYHQKWEARESHYRELFYKFRDIAQRWEGKFRQVKHENNILRNRLYKKEKK